ncbi:MAG: HAD-IA family hydrolase [Acidobacteriota bacterium]
MSAALAACRTLFLDAGGVLVNPSWSRVSEALAREGVVVSAERLAAAEPPAKLEIDQAAVIGRTTDRSRGGLYFRTVLRHAGVPPAEGVEAALEAIYAYHQRENLWEDTAPGLREALAAFREMGLRLVVVSNANGRLHHLLDRLALTPAFDAVIDSHLWGVEKPDPRLFQHALDAAGATAADTVHVGDLYHVDVVGARAAGLADAVLVDVAGLYAGADCLRVADLAALARLMRDLRAPTAR